MKKTLSVDILSSRKPKKIRLLNNVKYIQCDITKKKKLEKKITKNYDFVVNLGGYVDHTNKQKTFESHYNGSVNLANIFRKRNVKSFVQIGSSGEYGNNKSPHKENSKCNPRSNYALAKYLSTKYMIMLSKKYKFPVKIIRFYQIYGPRQDLNRFLPIVIKNCLRKKKFDTSDGTQYRDFLFIDDAVKAIIKSIYSTKANGKIINIGFGKAFNLKKIIHKIQNITKGGKINFGKIKMRPEENQITFPSITRAKKILKWRPKVSLNKGLNSTIKFFRETK